MEDNLKIDKDIPLPEEYQIGENEKVTYRNKCFKLIDKMDIGDSILIERAKYTVRDWISWSLRKNEDRIERIKYIYKLVNITLVWKFYIKEIEKRRVRLWRVK